MKRNWRQRGEVTGFEEFCCKEVHGNVSVIGRRSGMIRIFYDDCKIM